MLGTDTTLSVLNVNDTKKNVVTLKYKICIRYIVDS